MTRRRRTDKQLQQQQQSTPLKDGSGPGSYTDSDGTVDQNGFKRSLSKSPAKKCTIKKEGGGIQVLNMRAMSPPTNHIEKKCPVEGCDSSGHLSGNHERHFLPEACPIYHNMSVSECKERAVERKSREEQRLKLKVKEQPNGNETSCNSSLGFNSYRTLTPEQKEFATKIRESRAKFRPTSAHMDKIKKENDCTDEDREPCLMGLVPDYDLQLFREAQAIASEKIEDELKEPVGKGIR